MTPEKEGVIRQIENLPRPNTPAGADGPSYLLGFVRALHDAIEILRASPAAAMGEREEDEITVTIYRDDLEKLDQMISVFDALASAGVEGFYDDAWNMRNHMVPFKPGDEHYDAECPTTPLHPEPAADGGDGQVK